MSLIETPGGVATTGLGVEGLYLAARPEPLPAFSARIELSALADATVVDFPAGWGVRVAVDQAFAAAGVNRRVMIEVADVNTGLELVGAGLGGALLPRSLLARSGRLQTRRLASPLSWRGNDGSAVRPTGPSPRPRSCRIW